MTARRDAISSFEPMRAWAMDDPQLVGLFGRLGIGPDTRVLDVGCDSGGLLESLVVNAGLQPERAFGVDPNRDAVELGRDLCTSGIRLFVGEATDMPSLPFPCFDRVVCVGTLMYTRQRDTVQAIADITLVGGYVILVYETWLADLMWICSQGWPMRLRALRDLPDGVLSLAWQPPPSVLGRRAFVSTWRTTRQLRRLGFRRVGCVERSKGRPFLGRATQRVLVMRRAS